MRTYDPLAAMQYNPYLKADMLAKVRPAQAIAHLRGKPLFIIESLLNPPDVVEHTYDIGFYCTPVWFTNASSEMLVDILVRGLRKQERSYGRERP